MADAEAKIEDAMGKGKRALVVTDGIFSMRGDHAPLKEMIELCHKYDDEFEEGVVSVVDDSHGSAPSGKPDGAPRSTRGTRGATSSSARWARPSASTAASSSR